MSINGNIWISKDNNTKLLELIYDIFVQISNRLQISAINFFQVAIK